MTAIVGLPIRALRVLDRRCGIVPEDRGGQGDRA